MDKSINDILYDPMVGKIVFLALGIGVIWFIIRLVQRNLFSKIKQNDNRYKARKFAHFLGYLLTIVLITVVFSDKLGGLTVAFGVAGAGIAFALQEVIASFAGWLAIMFGGFYKTGDRVQLGGTKGDVMDIGVLRTTLMETGQWVDGDLYNGRIVLIANSFVFKEPVFNYSGEFPFLWDELKITVQYGSDYEKAKQILLNAGAVVAETLSQEIKERWQSLQRKYRLEEARMEPMVSLVAAESNVELTLRYIVDYKRRRLTKTELYTFILKEIDATGGAVKFASSTIQIVEPSDLNVHIKNRDFPG